MPGHAAREDASSDDDFRDDGQMRLRDHWSRLQALQVYDVAEQVPPVGTNPGALVFDSRLVRG